MLILIVAATELEIAPLRAHLQKDWTMLDDNRFQRDDTVLQILVTGIGQVATAFSLGVVLSATPPDLAINIGIAGALDRSIALASVVHVAVEQFADLGIEEADGYFSDLFETGLLHSTQFPFTAKRLLDPRASGAHFLPQAKGITVNKVHGYEPSIAALRTRYPDAQVESMEGAAFFYACLIANVPFIQIRGISNYVEKRNKAEWQIKPAIEAVNAAAWEMISAT